MGAYLRSGAVSIAQLLLVLTVGMTGAWAKPSIVEYTDNEYNFAFQYPSNWIKEEVPKGNEFGETRVMLKSPPQGVACAFWVMISHVAGKSVSREKFNDNPNREAIVQQFMDNFLIEQLYKKGSGLKAEKMEVTERRALPCDIGIKMYISTLHFLPRALPISLSGIHIIPYDKEYMVHFMMSTALDSKAAEEKETLTNIFNSFHLIGENPISELAPENHRGSTSQNALAKIAFVIIGLIFGLFAFSQIVYPLFSAWPRARRLEREGKLKESIPVSSFIIAPIIWTTLVSGSVLLVKSYFPIYIGVYLIALGFIFLVVIAQIPKKNRDLEADFKATWGKYLREEEANMLNSHDFETWSQFWISTTSHYAQASLIQPQSMDQFVTDHKKRIANLVFDYINPICINFIDIVVGKAESSYAKEVTQGVCINRLLGKGALHLLPAESSQTISQLLQETFYLGVFTQLYFFTFPTRELREKVNIRQLQQKWEINAIAADYVMGYYGDPKNPMCMELWKYHFKTKVNDALKNHLKIGFFDVGRYEAFFRNIYLSGALLVMYYDLSTKT